MFLLWTVLLIFSDAIEIYKFPQVVSLPQCHWERMQGPERRVWLKGLLASKSGFRSYAPKANLWNEFTHRGPALSSSKPLN